MLKPSNLTGTVFATTDVFHTKCTIRREKVKPLTKNWATALRVLRIVHSALCPHKRQTARLLDRDQVSAIPGHIVKKF